MTKEEAKEKFRALVRQYGLRWTAKVPAIAYDQMREVNEVLNEGDRREALGLPR
jgi:hypothetical protein